jgi:hypothetical protein
VEIFRIFADYKKVRLSSVRRLTMVSFVTTSENRLNSEMKGDLKDAGYSINPSFKRDGSPDCVSSKT